MAKLSSIVASGGNFAIEVNADKTTDGLTVVERIFRVFIEQAKAWLRNLHAQYLFQPDR